jgi:hypothetical protein
MLHSLVSASVLAMGIAMGVRAVRSEHCQQAPTSQPSSPHSRRDSSSADSTPSPLGSSEAKAEATSRSQSLPALTCSSNAVGGWAGVLKEGEGGRGRRELR